VSVRVSLLYIINCIISFLYDHHAYIRIIRLHARESVSWFMFVVCVYNCCCRYRQLHAIDVSCQERERIARVISVVVGCECVVLFLSLARYIIINQLIKNKLINTHNFHINARLTASTRESDSYISE